jgi:hypothetical protein
MPGLLRGGPGILRVKCTDANRKSSTYYDHETMASHFQPYFWRKQ